MAEKENVKKNWTIDAFQVVACRDKKLAPFLNVFAFEGLTPQQKKLGRLFGAIQIFDHNEKSAYLPNLIAQVIKKEFFQNEKRSLEESFESALRRANLALADLASHEIVGWIGKFHAVVGAIRENDFWFTQSGGGKIILIRKKIANEISAGLDSEENASHPLKTFSNISSGKLEADDKLIFSTENIFSEKRREEFSRHVTVFSSAELDNLLRSTVELELENDGFVLVNLQLSESPLETKESDKENLPPVNLNFFGKKENAPEKNIPPEEPSPRPKETPDEQNNSSPFEQEPELYIKENEDVLVEEEALPSSDESSQAEIPEMELSPETPEQKEAFWKKLLFWQHPQVQSGMNGLRSFSQKNWKKLDSLRPDLDFGASREKITRFFQKEEAPTEEKQVSDESAYQEKAASGFSLASWRSFFSKLFSSKKILILVPVLVVLLFFSFWLARTKKDFTGLSQEKSTTENNLPSTPEKEKPADSFKELGTLPEKIILSAILKENLYFITENGSFYQAENLDQKEASLRKIDLPSEVSSVQSLAGMEDLNLVFLSTEKEVFSYSPVTGKILPNTVENLPKNKAASFSYLTYLYFLDPTTNQINQYPRAGTGFGAKKDWLKETAELGQAIDFSADDSIYILFADGKITKYFRGKKTAEFYPEKAGERITGKKIRTSLQGEWLFILDPEKESVSQLTKSGEIVHQWFGPQLKDSLGMEVNFNNKTVFLFSQEQKIIEIKY